MLLLKVIIVLRCAFGNFVLKVVSLSVNVLLVVRRALIFFFTLVSI